jgi:hypothetical protein
LVLEFLFRFPHGAMQGPRRRGAMLHCENVMNYASLILFIDNFLDRESMRLYQFEPWTALNSLENELGHTKCCTATTYRDLKQ